MLKQFYTIVYNVVKVEKYRETFYALYNELLHMYKKRVMELLFLSKDVEIDKISVAMSSHKGITFMTMGTKEAFQTLMNLDTSITEKGKSWTLKETSMYLFFFRELCAGLFGGKSVLDFQVAEAYFPTSRTGFVLNYKMLVDYLIKPSISGVNNHQSNYTMPSMDFLQCINWISETRENKEYKEIISFMEKNVISGSLTLGKNYSTEFFYNPQDGKTEHLQMKLCSGVVTEVALVILFLKYLPISSITIEEPEMCLHPRLQWQYARAFIKMYNAGLPILMATHSDIFMAQVNNMIKLSNNPDKENLMKQYNYQEDDLVSAGDVKVYQFDVQESGYTKITEIEADEDGFKIPSFQKALSELLQESIEFELEEP